jgi:hypothetical protein
MFRVLYWQIIGEKKTKGTKLFLDFIKKIVVQKKLEH